MSVTATPVATYGAMDNSSDGELFPSSSSSVGPLTFASRLSHGAGDSSCSSSCTIDGHGHEGQGDAINTSAVSSINANGRVARRSARMAMIGMLVVAALVGIGFFAAFTYGGDSSSAVSSSMSSSSLTAAANHASPAVQQHTTPSSSTPALAEGEAAAAAIAQHNAAMGVTSTTLGDEYPRVKVGVYYDSLCPFSQKFLTGTLWNVWNAEGVRDIIDLQLIPFGNTKESVGDNGRYNFTCQHGPAECEGNMLQSCAVSILGSRIAYQYIYCMSKSANPNANAAQCAEQQKLDYGALKSCARVHGDEVLHRMGYQTDLLYPAHEYVPWLTINGFPIEDPSQLLRMVCKLHMGPRPAGCSLRFKAVRDPTGTSPRTDGEYNR